MEKEFIPYTEALALKELGFDEQCLALYDLDGKITIEFVNWKNAINRKDNYLISAPLYQQAFRWFREKYNLYSKIQQLFKEEKLLWFEFVISTNKTKSILIPGISSYIVSLEKDYKTYEEAELECLKKLIEIVKQK